MDRKPGWESRLVQLVIREQAAPFAWGEHDCATLALAAIKELTGEDLAAGLPKWFSAHSARRALKVAGAKSAAEFFTARLTEIPVTEAHRGDLVYPRMTRNQLMCPAVLIGAEAVSRNEESWLVIPRAVIVKAYRVG